MKGIFIPEITEEMFRNGCLESIETLMAEGKIYDIEYPLDKEQKAEWISVEDRLPEENKNVLVCYKCLCDKGFDCIYKTIGIGYCSFFGWFVKGVGQAVEVLAWMPLPEVYEKSEE